MSNEVSDQIANDFIDKLELEDLKKFDGDLTYNEQSGEVKLSIPYKALVIKVKTYLDQRSTSISPLLVKQGVIIPKTRTGGPIVPVDMGDNNFGDVSDAGIRRARQFLRRSEEFQKLAVNLTSGRADPGPSSKLSYVNMDQLRELQKLYEKETSEGVKTAKKKFLPLSDYAARFSKMKLPILQNEVGRFQGGKLDGKVAILKDKDLGVNVTTIGPSKNAGKTQTE